MVAHLGQAVSLCAGPVSRWMERKRTPAGRGKGRERKGMQTRMLQQQWVATKHTKHRQGVWDCMRVPLRLLPCHCV